MAFTQDESEIGALWVKAGAKGEYLTGTIGGQAVVCFWNDRKVAGSKQPDWRVLKAQAREDRPTLGARVPTDQEQW